MSVKVIVDGKPLSVEQAVSSHLKATSSYSSGALEDARDIAEKTADAVAVLVQTLADRGLLTERQVSQMVRHESKIEWGG